MVRTLIDALCAPPSEASRGVRFLTLRGEEHYYSYAALAEQARRRAAKFMALGLKKGDRVALVIPNAEEFVLSFLGATVAGLISVPVYPRAGGNLKTHRSYSETVSHIVRSAGARMLLTSGSTKKVIEEALAADVGLERVVTLEELAEHEPAPCSFPAVRPRDLCFLQFTSGSTSLPKGVMVTHGNLVANAQAFLGPSGLDLREDDVAVGWLPLYHDMGLIGFVVSTLIFGARSVLLPTEAFVRRPGIWMEAMSRYGGTITFAPNFAYALAARRTRDQDLERLDLRRVRVAGCGAEPVNADVMRQFCARFAAAGFRPEALLPCYGMAEATLAITFHRHDAPIVTDTVCASALGFGKAVPASRTASARAVELVSCGRPFLGHELMIVDESGQPLPERRVGEIVSRGPSTTVGYFGQPLATAMTYRDGWLYTGDLGYLADGELYVCGRCKDLIIIRGVNYYPQDIEWAVAQVPGVQRAAVVAFSVEQGGEEALVVCAEGKPSDADALRRAIIETVAGCAGLKPAHVAVVQVGSLPKTSSGKVQRRKTKAQFERGELEEHPAALPEPA